jgi:hypothetical protein
MHLDPTPLPHRPRNRDLDPLARAHAPERAGGPPTQHRSLDRQHRRHPDAVPRESRMTDRVHAAVDSVQATGPDAVVHRVRSQANVAHLPPRDDAVLRAGKLGDVRVTARWTFAAYVAAFVGRVGHAASLATDL